MSRQIPEWFGKTDNSPIPPRVKLRIFERCSGRCQLCSRKVLSPKYDHIVSLINSGLNRENNIQVLCESCHSEKTTDDVKIKSKTYRMAAKHAGIKRKKSKPIMGSRASGWKRKIDGTVVKR